jgi:5-methylthioadenosine/S-adenosylhomocysteine deaminase
MNRLNQTGALLSGLLLLLLAGPGAADNRSPMNMPDGAPIVLRGTLLTPDGVIDHGYIAIANGRILSVSERHPDLPDAVTVNTHGIIAPGFVDVHNHVPWNVLPRWSAGHLFTNRNQWRADPGYNAAVEVPFANLRATHFCDMNAWGELRALVGGTTSTMSTQPVPCIHGLVRNLDYNTGFYGTTELNLEHIINVLELPPATNPLARAQFVGQARFAIGSPFFEALAIHLAEGTDAAAEEEFTFIQAQHLLNPKGVIIHGISLDGPDFLAMAATGTALVWSPRSNIELYGQTTNVMAAIDAGVEVALAPDWAITGSSNMLDELRFAAHWNRRHLGGRLSDRQLFDMVTSVPARITGVDDQVGTIRAGLRADLVVIEGRHHDPYAAIVEASAEDVQLILIDGVPLYGDRTLMEHFWDRRALEKIRLPGGVKALATPAAAVVAGDVASRLRPALEAEGTSLAPLAE